MNGSLYNFFVGDHRRLEKLLNRAWAQAPEYDMALYGEFRLGLLRHIKMEENVIIPEAQKIRGGQPLAFAQKLRLEHAALVALLVPPPSAPIINALRAILTQHNKLEESEGGLYDLCEQLVGQEADEVMKMVESVQDVPVLQYRVDSTVMGALRRALERAGYKLDDYL